jgi:hypothetical protein
VCRVGGIVLSYVDYTVPCNDKYRIEVQAINWGESSSIPDNCVDLSLYDCIKIDALGGGYLRFAGVGSGVAYAGDLADFVGLASSSGLLWYQSPYTFGGIILAVVGCLLILKKVTS